MRGCLPQARLRREAFPSAALLLAPNAFLPSFTQWSAVKRAKQGESVRALFLGKPLGNVVVPNRNIRSRYTFGWSTGRIVRFVSTIREIDRRSRGLMCGMLSLKAAANIIPRQQSRGGSNILPDFGKVFHVLAGGAAVRIAQRVRTLSTLFRAILGRGFLLLFQQDDPCEDRSHLGLRVRDPSSATSYAR